MKRCSEYTSSMKEVKGKTPDGVGYSYFRCTKCGEKMLEMKRFGAKVTKRGMSLGVRIPKELAKRYNLKGESEVVMIPEKEGIRLVPI